MTTNSLMDHDVGGQENSTVAGKRAARIFRKKPHDSRTYLTLKAAVWHTVGA